MTQRIRSKNTTYHIDHTRNESRRAARFVLGTSEVPSRCLILAGTTEEQQIVKLLDQFDSFKRIARRAVATSYLVDFEDASVLFLFNVWGPSASFECSNLLIRNGAKNLLFVGWAGALAKLDIGTFILPSKVLPFDGITSLISPETKHLVPDHQLLRAIEMNCQQHSIPYRFGTTMCVPIGEVFRCFGRTAQELGVIAVEMEASPFLFVANKNAVPAAIILVTSDNSERSAHARGAERARNKAQLKAVRCATKVLRDTAPYPKGQEGPF